jgi:hypothetical protein
MFEQFLPNTNEILRCATVPHSKSGGAGSGQINKTLIFVGSPDKTDRRKYTTVEWGF